MKPGSLQKWKGFYNSCNKFSSPLEIDAFVAAKLRLRRIELGLKQGEIANSLGITSQQLSKYEQGINRIPVSRLYQLSKILEISLNFFFEGLDSKPTDFSVKISQIPKERKV